MPRYGLIWLEIAREQYASLPAAARKQIDQWTTTYGGGAGLIVYAVVHARQRLIILRLV
ncbi:MAG: hypothetical protein ACRDRP_25405 [Pseudonocardiaceae bacterium]